MKKNILLLFAIFTFCYSSLAQFTLYNSFTSGLTDNQCWYVNQAPDEKVWVAGYTNGAYTYSNNTWKNYNTGNSNISSNQLTPITFESNGDVWVGTMFTNGGVSKYSNGVWTKYTTSNSGLPHNDITTIVIDSVNNKWIGTRGGGLAKFNGTSWTIYNTSNSNIPSNIIYSLGLDDKGNIWVGTALAGLAKFNGMNWTTYTEANSPLPDNDIYSLKYNKVTKAMWVGTYTGIAVIGSNSWTLYSKTTTNNFPGNHVRGIVHSYTTGNTYIASGEGGIGRFDGYNWKTFMNLNSNLPSNKVWSINMGLRETIWASMIDGGIVSFGDVSSGINEVSNLSIETTVFPNPASNSINITINSTKTGQGKITVYDVIGKLVAETPILIANSITNNNYTINTSSFTKGIYNYTILFENEQKNGKFIVE